MKNKIFIALFLVSILYAKANNLLETYKKGDVKLVPDKTYAVGNDWGNIFKTYYDTIYGKPMGNRKSIVLLPDGGIVVNHAYRNYYSKFDANGKFVEEFGVTNSQGKRFKKTKAIAGVIDGNTFITGLDNLGKMDCFDFEGRFIKNLTLDYMTHGMVVLPNNKIAVVGWVIWKTKFRDFVAIVDYKTNEQKIIWDHFTDRNGPENHKLFNYSYGFEKRGMISFNTMPFTKRTGIPRPKIASVKNHLIVALPETGEIFTFDLNGNKISSKMIDWPKNYISVEEQKEIQQKAIEKYKSLKSPMIASWVSPEENKKAMESIIKEMEADLEKISEPISKPVFSTILTDSDDNLLFFEFPEEEGANKFNVWVYQQSGIFVCKSSFQCDEYDLEINPSKMVFKDGYIYGLQKLKETTGNPLRLVRFKILD